MKSYLFHNLLLPDIGSFKKSYLFLLVRNIHFIHYIFFLFTIFFRIHYIFLFLLYNFISLAHFLSNQWKKKCFIRSFPVLLSSHSFTFPLPSYSHSLHIPNFLPLLSNHFSFTWVRSQSNQTKLSYLSKISSIIFPSSSLNLPLIFPSSSLRLPKKYRKLFSFGVRDTIHAKFRILSDSNLHSSLTHSSHILGILLVT